MEWTVPLADTALGEEEEKAALEVLRSGWLTQGARVEAFERAFAEAIGARHAVAVTNGTAALQLAYAALGLGTGDEFILPALTFVATMNAGLALGAKPILADCVSSDDLTLSAEDVARKITPKTRLIVSMPYGGFCPDMPALAALAAERGIALVEDAAHAPLAALDGRCMGAFGQAGTFSFFSNKNITTGEGGMIVTDDDALDRRMRLLRSHGMTTLTWDRHRGHAADYDVVEPGFNFRLDELRAAIGLAQLRKLPDLNRRRTEAARLLRDAIAALEIPGLAIPFSSPRGTPAHHLFVILLPEKTDRAAFRRKMAERGIQTSVHYPLPHRFSCARKIFGPGADSLPRVPVAESIETRLLTLPMGPRLDADSIARIAEAISRSL